MKYSGYVKHCNWCGSVLNKMLKFVVNFGFVFKKKSAKTSANGNKTTIINSDVTIDGSK